MGFSISKENIAKGLNTLNTFNSTEGNGTTRVLFTDEEVKAREYIKSLMQECGLTVTEDAIGNIFGTLEGTAGLKVNDMILEVDGQKVSSTEEVNEIRDKKKAGDYLTFKILRDGETMEVQVRLMEDSADKTK